MSGARFDTRRRALGLSIAETAVVCSRDGTPVSERTINRWINDVSAVPEDAFEALDRLEERMEATVDALTAAADDITMEGPVTVRRYRTAEDLLDSPDDVGLPLGAHAMMIAWLDDRLAADGIETDIVWADTIL